MANWAKLQEQLTGLPVVKRARHGIHFDKGNGEIVANFSGKPCHFQDTDGLWKPIDTKLLLGNDGFYGCPHSPVKVHKDGRVKAGGYQQKSALVDAKEGVVDGDKIVREFKFGTQYLYMKEDGFRQETVITRPPTTAEAKYLIASESGELPSKYKRSDITAVDADGAVHEFVNLGQFKKWLDAAAYPVTIDPDFSTGASEDTTLRSAYPTRSYGGLNIFSYTPNLIRFDCSSIPATAEASAAHMHFTKSTVAGGATTEVYNFYSVSQANADWVAGANQNPATNGQSTWGYKRCYNNAETNVAWAGSDGLGTSGTDYETTLLASFTGSRADDQYTQYTCNFNSSGLTRINGWFGATNTNYGLIFALTSTVRLYTSDEATESYRPVLSVTYAAAGVPKHFLHYARLRG